MSDIICFNTPDNTTIELIVEKAEQPDGIVLVWPCTMGDVRMYRMPTKAFAQKGYTCVLYNPRGHGGSGGQFTIPDGVNDLEFIMNDFNNDRLPLISVGHSGGCGGLLNFGRHHLTRHYFLVAPVLDSRKSLAHMYNNKSIHEFNMMLAAYASDQALVLSTLETDSWLELENWRGNNLRERLDAVSGDLKIGRFLEKLFIEGISGYEHLEAQSEISELILPSVDNWYPLESTREFAGMRHIPINDTLDAHDHYFTRAWENVWQYVLASV